MITKDDRLELITESKKWWDDVPNKEEYADAYFSNYMKHTGKIYSDLHAGQIVSMFLHEFYLTVKKLNNE